MSTSKFMRLFREIEKSYPDEVPTDFTYQKEREEIIQTLIRPQFKDKNNLPELTNIGFKEPIQPNRHHGKGARTVSELNQTKKMINNGQSSDDLFPLKKSHAIKQAETKVNSATFQDLKRQIRLELKLHEETQPIIREIDEYVQLGQPVPPHLLLRLSTNQNSFNFSKAKKASAAGAGTGAPSTSVTPGSTNRPSSSVSRKKAPGTLPPVSGTPAPPSDVSQAPSKDPTKKRFSSSLPIYQKTLITSKNYVQALSAFSNISAPKVSDKAPKKKEVNIMNKWTKEEKEKINSIYLSIPPPDIHWPLGMWRIYLASFADKFRVYFPQRKQEEIMDKVREMIEKKQIKQPGEEEYWKGFAPGAQNKGKER